MAIANSPVGHLVPISGMDPWRGELYEHQAFVPAALPRDLGELRLSDETWSAVVGAAGALAKLDQAGRQVPNPELVRRPTLRREAQSTSALEGTYAAFTDVLEADLDVRVTRSAEVREVLNYVKAAEIAFNWIEDRPLTLGLLGELQGLLVRDTAGELSDAGGVRDRQVVVGQQRGPITEARFIPPPPGNLLDEGVQAWLSWVNSTSEMPEVVRAALAHYQFETLHPFSDGNGRLGRLIVVLQLMQYGVLHYPLLIVSPWFETRRRDYQDQLLAVSETGDFDPWVRFFAEGLRAQAEETVRRIVALLDYQEELRTMIRDQNIRGVRAKLMEDIIGQPIVAVTWAQHHYGVSYQTANEAVARLVRDGILKEMTGRSYARLFMADRVLTVVED
ncbi:MAG TPA: Fic/DOC family N-terminal domain-containing protein [Thermoleophilaceae bacterium]|nr:Fic/DOC family N-terminal domain-containing protein [Thermoleophilaceae bacterium]